MAQHETAQSVIRKVLVTCAIGALTFPLTNVLFDSAAAQFATAAGAGGVILIIQFLIDFEKRLEAVERELIKQTIETHQAVDRGFSKVNEVTELFAEVKAAGLDLGTVTQLVRRVSGIGPDAPPLVSAFVQSEIDRISQFFHGLTGNETTYDGEDRDWLFALTRSVTSTIHAVSLLGVDADGKFFGDGFWVSDIGHRYLELQREAVQREVRIRRVFIVERNGPIDDPGLRAMCGTQAKLGIDVRFLHLSAVPDTIKNHLYDFTLFDDVLSYEVTPAAHLENERNPSILTTRLVLRQARLDERKERYRQLWTIATPFADEDSESIRRA
jgi:hypothetical protein